MHAVNNSINNFALGIVRVQGIHPANQIIYQIRTCNQKQQQCIHGTILGHFFCFVYLINNFKNTIANVNVLKLKKALKNTADSSNLVLNSPSSKTITSRHDSLSADVKH